MVKGLETFRKAMQPYKEHFVIIGGTACDIQLTGSAMTPRATDDIDIIVVIEKLTEDFVRAIWQFVKDGNYKAEKRLSQQGQSVYALYRFTLQDENWITRRRLNCSRVIQTYLVSRPVFVLNPFRLTKIAIVCLQSLWMTIITILPSIIQMR